MKRWYRFSDTIDLTNQEKIDLLWRIFSYDLYMPENMVDKLEIRDLVQEADRP